MSAKAAATGADIPPAPVGPVGQTELEVAAPAEASDDQPERTAEAPSALPEPAAEEADPDGLVWADETTDQGRAISVSKGLPGQPTLTRQEVLKHGANAAQVAAAKARLRSIILR